MPSLSTSAFKAIKLFLAANSGVSTPLAWLIIFSLRTLLWQSGSG